MREYIAEIKKDGAFLARLRIEAGDRGQAVHKAQLYFWERYRGRLGFAHEALVVNDLYGEVNYTPDFNCGAKKNRLLPEDSIERLLCESAGELIRNTTQGKKHHAPTPLRRVKRRRDLGVTIAPNIRAMKNGRLYYRIILRSQVVHNGRRYRKRKDLDVPLTARTLSDAIVEIRHRRLLEEHNRACGRRVKVRALSVLERIAGVTATARNPRRYVRVAINYYRDRAAAYL